MTGTAKSGKLTIPDSLALPEFDRPPGLPATCSDRELLDAVKASIVGATDEDLAPLLHCPITAVKHWVSSKEWTAIKQHVIPEMKGYTHTELCGLRSTVIRQLAERVRKGDPMYNNLGEPVTDRDGNPVYRPVKAKELAGILVQTSEVLHQLEIEIGVVTDDRGKVDLDLLTRGLMNLAKQDKSFDITGQSSRLS